MEVFGDLGPDDLLLYATLSAALDPPSRSRRLPMVQYGGVTSRMIALAQRDLGKKAVEAWARPFDEREAALMDGIGPLPLD